MAFDLGKLAKISKPRSEQAVKLALVRKQNRTTKTMVRYEIRMEEKKRYDHRMRNDIANGWISRIFEYNTILAAIVKARQDGDRAKEAVVRLRMEKHIKAVEQYNRTPPQ